MEEWLARRTFDGAAFDPERLLDARRRSGDTISVCLPTLDVEDTVGPIVAAIRERWMERLALVDELIVIDSASTDATTTRAREAGATVVRDADVLPELGPGRGKGEALWKSLAATRGTIVVWIDSDIVDFDRAFVPGLIGPLLTTPALSYVKAFYHRTLADGSLNGGRVTEICARPLINQFYPQLAGFIQPLSGEAAGRRAALEAVPFFGGYAVELGLLIDLLGTVGLEGLGQVDLGVRHHVNQPTDRLGLMAATITRAVLRRLIEDGRAPIELLSAGPFRRPSGDGESRKLEKHRIEPTERPPMARARDGAQ